MGAMPVEGPTILTSFEPVETLWINDYMTGIDPENAPSQEEIDNWDLVTTLNYASDPPYGITLGYCQSKPCADDEEPVYLDDNIDYDVFAGYYFMITTAAAYENANYLRSEVY